MAVNDPTFSYGRSEIFESSGTDPVDYWSYGMSIVLHEFAASAGGSVPIIQNYRRMQGEL